MSDALRSRGGGGGSLFELAQTAEIVMAQLLKPTRKVDALRGDSTPEGGMNVDKPRVRS